jgi:hypothetical protein
MLVVPERSEFAEHHGGRAPDALLVEVEVGILDDHAVARDAPPVESTGVADVVDRGFDEARDLALFDLKVWSARRDADVGPDEEIADHDP